MFDTLGLYKECDFVDEDLVLAECGYELAEPSWQTAAVRRLASRR
jgi:hypothetical protein